MRDLPSALGGVLAVSAFVIFWFNFIYVLFPATSEPSAFSLALVPGLVFGGVLILGPVLLFLFAFVKRFEARTSIKSAISSLGLNRTGVRKSLLWALPFFALIILSTIVISIIGVGLFGPGAFSHPYQSSLPRWYAIETLVYSIFSSYTEETVGVGYIVDRLMPTHPATLAKSTPAVLVRSVVAVLYHVGTYFILFRFSLVTASLSFVTAFVGFTIIGFAYVKSGVRNISGPWAMHYLLDVLMVLETYPL